MILLKQQAENQRPIFAAIVLHTHCINWLALMQLPESSATQNSQTYVHLQNSKKTRRFKKLVSIDAATRILSYSELSNICPPPKLEKNTKI